MLHFCAFTPSIVGEEQLQIRVDDQTQQEMSYGMDFERLFHYGPTARDSELRKELFRLTIEDLDISYVRVGIKGLVELKSQKQPERDWSVYEDNPGYKQDKQLQVMRAIREVDPEIDFFVSPRPFHVSIHSFYGANSHEAKNAPFTCFPLSIGVFDNPFDPDKRKFREMRWDLAADYLTRHIRFLREQGFRITYMDAQNENTKFYRPPEISQMIDRMRDELGEAMPKVIAPSGWSWKGSSQWVEEAIEIGRTDFFDIVASHDTSQKWGSPERVGELGRELNKPVWNTEKHAGLVGPDEVAASNSQHLFRSIRAGFASFNPWMPQGGAGQEHKMLLTFKDRIETRRIYHIWKQLVNTSAGGHYLDVNIPDGLTTTAAFLQDNRLTVWVLNDGEEMIEEIAIDVSAHNVGLDKAQVVSWGPDDPREGSTQVVHLRSRSSLEYNIQAKTLYCFTFLLRNR